MDKQGYIAMNQSEFQNFIKLPADTAVVMMNLMKFKDLVPETGLSGAETYKRYLKEAMPFFAKANAEVVYMGKPKSILIGPEDETLWDKLLLIKYNSITDFLTMVQAEGYPAHLRTQALEDSRLIHCE